MEDNAKLIDESDVRRGLAATRHLLYLPHIKYTKRVTRLAVTRNPNNYVRVPEGTPLVAVIIQYHYKVEVIQYETLMNTTPSDGWF